MGSKIIGIGGYLPDNVVKVEEEIKRDDYFESLQKYCEGGSSKRHAKMNDTPTYMGVKAAKEAIENSKLSLSEIDMVIFYTPFFDYMVPRDGSFVVAQLGLKNACCWHLDVACTSFVSALKCGHALVVQKMHKNVLIIISTSWVRVHEKSKNTSALGDGAAAVMLTHDPIESSLICVKERIFPDYVDNLTLKSPLISKQQEVFIVNKEDSFKDFVLKGVPEFTHQFLQESEVEIESIDWFIAHQPGVKVIHAWSEYLNIPSTKALSTFDHTANMTATNIPYILYEFTQIDKKIKRGDTILFLSIGVGLVTSVMVWKY